MTFRPYARKVRLGDTETFLDISNLPDGYVLSRKGSEIVAELIGQSKLGLESPVNVGDAATKGYVDDEIESAESALQSSLNSEISARVAGDASEASARAAAISSEASSRVAGDASEASARAAAVAAEESARVAGDAAEASARVAAIAAEASSRAAGDSNLQGQINDILSNVDPDALDSLTEIVSAFQSADGYLLGVLENLSTGSSSALGLETSARVAADAALQLEIDTEESARAAGDLALATSLGDETSARVAGDAAEASARAAAVSAEESARIAGDAALATSLGDETSARVAGDAAEASARAAAVSAEESARAAGDSNLQGQINDILSNVDPDALDSLTEIVSAFQSADGYLLSVLENLSTGSSSALGLETSARVAADAALQLEIDTEESARAAGDAALTVSLGSETSARAAADAALQLEIDTEESARAAGDAALTVSLGDETSARVAADLVLQGNIDSEVSARVAGDAALTTSLGAETSARVAADTALTNNLDSEISARIAGDIASRLLAVRTVTESGAITASDDLVLIDGTGSTVVTLPTAVGNSGKKIIVKKVDNFVGEPNDADTVAAALGEEIDGGLSANLYLQYEAITFVSNGTKWLIV